MMDRVLGVCLAICAVALGIPLTAQDTYAQNRICRDAPSIPLSSIYLKGRRYSMWAPSTLEDLVVAAARLERVDKDLLRAMVCVESKGDPYAVSPVGAIGLLQILPSTAEDLGITDRRWLTDPWINLRIGARYIKQLLNLFDGNYLRAVKAYHGGAQRVKSGRVGPQTRSYAAKVLALYYKAKHNSEKAMEVGIGRRTKPLKLDNNILE